MATSAADATMPATHRDVNGTASRYPAYQLSPATIATTELAPATSRQSNRFRQSDRMADASALTGLVPPRVCPPGRRGQWSMVSIHCGRMGPAGGLTGL